jgi:predicted DNA-binding protein
MSNQTRKTIRITSEMQTYIEDLAKYLNFTQNDVIKMIIWEYMRKN